MPATETFIIAPQWQSLLRAHRLDTIDAFYARERGTTVKRSASTEVRRVELNGHALFVKMYWVTKKSQLWSGLFRGTFFGISKVRREFENMARLRDWGLDAPEPVAYGEQRHCGWLMRSLLVSEGIADPVPLDRFIVETITPHLNPLPQTSAASRGLGSPRGERKRTAPLSLPKGEGQGEGFARSELIDNLADYVRRLHAHRFEHHDLYWRNIILSGDALTHFYLLDAHKGRVWNPDCEQEARTHDLATLDAPAPAFFRRTERLRFLLRYLGKQRLDEDGKKMARLVLAVAGPMRERQLARVREARR